MNTFQFQTKSLSCPVISQAAWKSSFFAIPIQKGQCFKIPRFPDAASAGQTLKIQIQAPANAASDEILLQGESSLLIICFSLGVQHVQLSANNSHMIRNGSICHMAQTVHGETAQWHMPQDNFQKNKSTDECAQQSGRFVFVLFVLLFCSSLDATRCNMVHLLLAHTLTKLAE